MNNKINENEDRMVKKFVTNLHKHEHTHTKYKKNTT